MITITYEYRCDFCNSEIMPPQRHEYGGGQVALTPDRVHMLENRVLCHSCANAAYIGIRERLKKK